MIPDKSIAELLDLQSSVFRSIRYIHTMMKMNLNLSPARATVRREPVNQPSIVLLGREKIGVRKSAPFLIAPCIHRARVFSAPRFHATFLFRKGRTCSPILRQKRGFEVIGQSNDQMDSATRD